MSIYFNRGQRLVGGYNGQGPSSPRGSPRIVLESAEPTASDDALDATGSGASESGLQAMALSQEPDPGTVKRAVKEANELASAEFKAHQSSIEFGVHKPSGRITITIREDLNGAVIEREIPPKAFLKLYERLKEAKEGLGLASHRGNLLNVDA